MAYTFDKTSALLTEAQPEKASIFGGNSVPQGGPQPGDGTQQGGAFQKTAVEGSDGAAAGSASGGGEATPTPTSTGEGAAQAFNNLSKNIQVPSVLGQAKSALSAASQGAQEAANQYVTQAGATAKQNYGGWTEQDYSDIAGGNAEKTAKARNTLGGAPSGIPSFTAPDLDRSGYSDYLTGDPYSAIIKTMYPKGLRSGSQAYTEQALRSNAGVQKELADLRTADEAQRAASPGIVAGANTGARSAEASALEEGQGALKSGLHGILDQLGAGNQKQADEYAVTHQKAVQDFLTRAPEISKEVINAGHYFPGMTQGFRSPVNAQDYMNPGQAITADQFWDPSELSQMSNISELLGIPQVNPQAPAENGGPDEAGYRQAVSQALQDFLSKNFTANNPMPQAQALPQPNPPAFQPSAPPAEAPIKSIFDPRIAKDLHQESFADIIRRDMAKRQTDPGTIAANAMNPAGPPVESGDLDYLRQLAGLNTPEAAPDPALEYGSPAWMSAGI